MPLIIERYLLREVVVNFFSVSLLLIVMFFSTTFFRLVTEALEGEFPVGILFSLFALKVGGNIVFILPLAFFLAVILALSRMYKDNEIVVLMACGVGPKKLFASIGFLAFIMALLVAYMTLFFAPWMGDKTAQLQDTAKAQQQIEGVVPGRFNSFGPHGPTVYAERFDADSKRIHGVMVQAEEGGRQMVLSAATAYEHTMANGARYLVLEDGYRYEGVRGQHDYRIIQFGEHGILITAQEITPSSRPRKAVGTGALWQSDDGEDVAELHWRLAMPLSTILLALLAIPLSKSSPRRGRYAGLFFGIVLYVVYNNLLIVGRSSLSKGEASPLLGLWWVHALMLALLLLMVWRQSAVRTPRFSLGRAK